MDGGCGSISMDAYWNYVGTPLFFVVLTFAVYVLFALSDVQLISTSSLYEKVRAIGKRHSATVAPMAPSAPPAPVAKNASK